MHSADYAVARCQSVRLSVRHTPVSGVNGYPQSFFYQLNMLMRDKNDFLD